MNSNSTKNNNNNNIQKFTQYHTVQDGILCKLLTLQTPSSGNKIVIPILSHKTRLAHFFSLFPAESDNDPGENRSLRSSAIRLAGTLSDGEEKKEREKKAASQPKLPLSKHLRHLRISIGIIIIRIGLTIPFYETSTISKRKEKKNELFLSLFHHLMHTLQYHTIQ
ncbi:hypothetical protein L873DRAFT_92199 [Choiromyces venosus 120613-1]|uniref:Uncharacterized protein n=1 Tax=Choiromyces venosus 120613-1 TaxID=1336337 RepID=A0A3N4K063_9PEZI|nr:hypothetical protein L873DRAFT_92199 [Choiromyces venosus 120613-1]